ncbi:MAG: ABC transporter substrate-binding protein [Deltaproteobacteria bacterium]|jgi:ABC-type nitrate/sulfonate/bicarbonate transport system substrate-binding protein|nr:ABC transporter substrate-binding protein [Deltaproteobacteria bacterium]
MHGQTFPALKAGFETTGSTRWVMQTINDYQLDLKNGFELNLILHDQQGDARRTSPETALQAGEIDFIDTDWLSIGRARAAGIPFTAAYPYGRIMGGLLACESSGINSPGDLEGHRIGLLRETDKNWKVLRAWVKQNHGFDPAETCETVVVPSKIELESQLKDQRFEAALIFWHRIPEILNTPWIHQVCDIVDLVESLIDASPATTFFVFRDEFVNRHSHVIVGFCQAYREAIQILVSCPESWYEIVGLPSSKTLDQVYALWQRRMVTSWSSADFDNLVRLHQVVAQIDNQAVPALDKEWFSCMRAGRKLIAPAMEV